MHEIIFVFFNFKVTQTQEKADRIVHMKYVEEHKTGEDMYDF